MNAAPDTGARAARRRDRRVYTRSRPLLFALLAAARRRPVLRLGGTVLVNGTEPYRHALTRIPLDRAAEGTTGGAARELGGGGSLFDEEGAGHRAARRTVALDLGAAGVERLRPVWRAVLDRRLAPLATGDAVDLVPLARELAGATVRALLDVTADPAALSDAAAEVAAVAVRGHLPGPGRSRAARAAGPAAARLAALLTPAGQDDLDERVRDEHVSGEHVSGAHVPDEYVPDGKPGRDGSGGAGREAVGEAAGHVGRSAGADTGREAAGDTGREARQGAGGDARQGAGGSAGGRAGRDAERAAARRAMLAVAAVNTTVAALPRAAAWCADAGLWEQAADSRSRAALVDELLRVVAPSPLLPRVAAADADLDGCPVRAGDRLILVARHAVHADDTPPDARCPVAPAVAQLVFGAGPHACPGARLARAQLDDMLAALAPFRPSVVAARADRRAALPGWRTLTVRATALAPGPHGGSPC
ncbi:cytochrome P450 [Streptomyces uncialis]|uniref:cytochrome P450 n=1 Tax=Streptomyces uncialis TaxID=1048205 RepID=UPI00225A7C7D|nr:cytochrome P450 [Streptomyces uncialis]MCX4658662.1 cytochrome P450 [Streptomyces uncialis]